MCGILYVVMPLPRRITYEPVVSKTVLNKVNAPSMPFEWSINPYRGCQHGCSFCYARATHTFLGMEADDTFQNHIFLKTNAARALEEQLTRLLRTRGGRKQIGRIAIGTATDPYQPAEARAFLTRQCLEVLAKFRIPASITTRSPLILRDLDLLRRIPQVSVNISANTLDLKIWRNMEPSTPSPLMRLKAVRRLAEAGIPAGIFLAPILPLLTDRPESLKAVIEAAAEHRAQFVMPSFLRFNRMEVKVWFFRNLQLVYPHLTEAYGRLYRDSPTVPPAYREPVMKEIRALLRRYGLSGSEPISGQNRAETESDGSEAAPVQLSFMF